MTNRVEAVKSFLDILRAFAHHRSGATAIEYALIAGGISIAIVVSVNLLGATVLDLYNLVAASF